MKLIQVSDTYAKVDDEDFERLNKFKWYLMRRENIQYAQRNSKTSKGKKTVTLMHKDVTGFKMCNHLNDDGLDNRKQNIEEMSKSEQSVRREKYTVGAHSEYKGVSKVSPAIDSKWKAYIKVSGERIHLGVYVFEENAALAYDYAAKRFFGRHANTNFEEGKTVDGLPADYPKSISKKLDKIIKKHKAKKQRRD